MFYSKRLKNIRLRYNFYKSESYSRALKFLYLKINKNFCFLKEKIAVSKNIIHNMCLYSSKSCSLTREYKVSRIVFREKASVGFFFGLKKAS
jgi:ribosomal protein S14